MVSEFVGERESSDIDKLVNRMLRDLGNPEPPLSLREVRELLKLDLKFYKRSDATLIEELTHRMRVAGKQIFARPHLLLEAIQKLDLKALWVPDKKRILIDQDVPRLKHRWIEGHEICHGIIPWHGEFLFGDNKQTLTPACDEIIEAEANYAAGRLLFLGDRFSEEALSLEANFDSIKRLGKRYGNTMTTTLWRMVEEREPGRAVFGLISGHPNHENIGKTEERLMRSNAFREKFGNILLEDAYNLLKKHISHRAKGPVAYAQDILMDKNGDEYEFNIESFCNTHDVLTYGLCIGKRKVIVSA